MSLSDYEFVPNDPRLASALDTAEKLAKEADEKFCAAFGGDGETVAYWLSQSIAGIRAALATQKTNVSDINEVAARMRKRVHGNYGPQSEVVMDTTDVLDLLAAYESVVRELKERDEVLLAVMEERESAIRERDEAQESDTESVAMYQRCRESRDHWMEACDAEILAHRNTRAALRRVREGVEGMRIARYNESVVREGGKPTDTVYFAIEPEGDWVRYEDYSAVLALLDREAPDAT